MCCVKAWFEDVLYIGTASDRAFEGGIVWYQVQFPVLSSITRGWYQQRLDKTSNELEETSRELAKSRQELKEEKEKTSADCCVH